MSIDLHCHTRLSDGSMGIEELVALAKNRGVLTISITDHDCLAGVVRGRITGERSGVSVIPGVELSAIDHETGKQVHILGYLFEQPDRLEALCQRNSVARKKAGQFMMIHASQKYPITNGLVRKCATGSTNLYKQHIMHTLMESGLTSTIYGSVYDELFSPQKSGNILVNADFADVREVIASVHEAGGLAVLAHPALYDNFDLLDSFDELGLDGVEVWHPTADEAVVERLTGFAAENGLLMTGGSDFHGMYNRGAWSVGDYSMPDSAFDELMSFKAKKKRRLKKEAAV